MHDHNHELHQMHEIRDHQVQSGDVDDQPRRHKRCRIGLSNPPSHDMPFAPRVNAPFLGDYSGCTWNAQALFAQEVSSQSSKMTVACNLARKYQILALQETHSTAGRVEGCLTGGGNVARLQRTHKLFWPHGSTTQAGVAIWVQNSLLEKFDAPDDNNWLEIIPGRVARLRLQGPAGALDIYVVYLQVGGEQEDKRARKQAIRAIAAVLAPREQALSIMVGDWNFVVNKDDRWSKQNGSWAGGTDAAEAREFADNFCRPRNFTECLQPVLTHECGKARSKLTA